MELYRVLLVDDEEDIREGISRKMDWLGLGFSLVGEAANGQDALELAESLRPDVILTDIKMPFMDGLELCRILTDRLPAARFVVFSGFDAFEYAKQAIQMNVVEYILKPINADELSAVLRRLKDQLDRERAERRNVELLRSRYMENLPILRELFYANLLDGRIEPGTERDRAAHLDIDLQGEEWAVGLAYIGSDRRDALSTLSIQNLLEETLTADRCKLSLYNDWVAVIVSLTESFTIYDLIRVLDRVCTLAASYLGLTLTVGVGAPCKELSGMARSAAEARTALEYRSMVGRGQVIYIGDLEPDGGQVLTFEEADERTLTAAVRLGSEQEVRDAAAALAGKIREANPSAGQYNLFLMELVTHLMKMTRRSGVGVEEVFGTGFSLPIQDSALPSLEELEDWCAERYLRLRTLIRRRQTDSAGQTVETAKEYIRQHYAESDLSVEKLCAYLHLSSTYFSTLFKRETGTSFTAYVTTVRMEAAAEAIRGTEEKTYLIAQRCGYDFNALLFQQLQADATGDAQGGCQPPGKRAAPGEICVTAVLHSGGIVRVAGAGHHGKAVIVPGAGVGVADDGGKRRAAGDVPHQTGKKFRLVRLLPRGGPIVAAGGTAVQKRLKSLHVDGLSGGQTLQGHADGRGMGLAEDGQMQKFSVPAHRPPPFNASKSSQKWG